jgi:hypothetical protein
VSVVGWLFCEWSRGGSRQWLVAGEVVTGQIATTKRQIAS